MANIKLNTECAFPSVLDLGPYTKSGAEAQAQGLTRPSAAEGPSVAGEGTVYELVGVVVHLGTSNFGHYFSYIRSREERALAPAPDAPGGGKPGGGKPGVG